MDWGGGEVLRVGGSCTTEGGVEEEGVYVVSSLLKSFLAGVETMVKRLRRGGREEKTAERETIFYTGRT